MPPKVIARNADRTGGVLPVSAAARANATNRATVRLKLEVRRLPPSLTLSEFEETIGEDWKLGNGKVDWREYRQGKTRVAGSGKVPEQSRCYLHVVNEAAVKDFERRFLEVVFQDKAGTYKNPELKNLQPTLGFAPNQRTPLQQAKQRTDNRQGTIDQDPEFIAFLESETQPITKPPAVESITGDKESERKEVKTTPLIEDLREKKANKAKAAQAKAERDKKTQPTKTSPKDNPVATEKDAGKATLQKKVDQAKKDAVRVLNKQAAGKQQQQSQPQSQQPKTSPSTKPKRVAQSPRQHAAVPAIVPASTTPSSPSPAAQRVPPGQRQRGNAEGIKKMLQKDLGIKPKALPNGPSASTANAATPPSVPSEPATPTAPSGSTSTAIPAVATEPKTSPLKAYLKHANPSQGMTEILIQQALAQYGEVANVTIDPRKGTAIAVFKQHEALKKALEAKRVPVANGAVEVLEYRDRAASGPVVRGGFRGGRPGRGASRGGGVQSGAHSPAVNAPSNAQTSS